jgi:hypothetical protein
VACRIAVTAHVATGLTRGSAYGVVDCGSTVRRARHVELEAIRRIEPSLTVEREAVAFVETQGSLVPLEQP